MSQPEIFVSYAWKGESETLVNQLCEAFAAKGYQIIRDKSAMTYKDSIKDFMESIGRGKFIIAVVGDKYMKSEYCMYEAYRMFQSPAFRERVFPIVLPDADVFSFRGQAAYLKYWDSEYKALEAEYKGIADVSPTMVAPLTERLREIETTTRFINDFMAAVGDMNVLTSQIHAESNFRQLISAIEGRMKSIEKDEPGEELAAGSDFTGVDFVGSDRNINRSGISIRVGGSVSGSSIVIGNNNTVLNKMTTQNNFGPVYQAIEQSARPMGVKDDLKAELQEIETAVSKGEDVDEAWLSRRLRNLKKIAPDIAEVALSALAGPGAVVATVVKKLAERVRAEA